MFEKAKIDHTRKSKLANGCWRYDAYPELEPLNAHKSVTLADLRGPAVITCFHITQNFFRLKEPNRRAIAARGLILEIYWNGEETPSVRVPLGDFFADGLGGEANHFSSRFVEKVPEAYNCYIPMPFEKSALIKLVNETDINFHCYSFIEYETLPAWDESFGYFHATWNRMNFALGHDTDVPVLHIDGEGQLIGRAYSVITREPFFRGFHFVMEGNNEFRIDGEAMPSINYLGTEDSFGFSWGFNTEYCGPCCGMNKIATSEEENRLSVYRFMDANRIRFDRSLDLRINWCCEWVNVPVFQAKIREITAAGGGLVDYAVTHYWYQKQIGFDHAPMQPYAERIR